MSVVRAPVAIVELLQSDVAVAILVSGRHDDMQSVFVLQHLHVFPGDDEDYKFIAVYSSRENAVRAVERLQLRPGFRDFPDLVADLGKGAKGAVSIWMSTGLTKMAGRQALKPSERPSAEDLLPATGSRSSMSVFR